MCHAGYPLWLSSVEKGEATWFTDVSVQMGQLRVQNYWVTVDYLNIQSVYWTEVIKAY
jgi:hypothetical protein